MAVKLSEPIAPDAYRFIPDTYSLVVANENESTAPSVVTKKWLTDMLMMRAGQLARDIRNAIQDGGLNEEGFAVDIPLWAECIEDITRVINFLNMEVARRKEVTLTLQYAGLQEENVWTIARVESAA